MDIRLAGIAPLSVNEPEGDDSPGERIIQRTRYAASEGDLQKPKWSASSYRHPDHHSDERPKVVGFNRNDWSASVGTGGRNQSESVVGLHRNMHLEQEDIEASLKYARERLDHPVLAA